MTDLHDMLHVRPAGLRELRLPPRASAARGRAVARATEEAIDDSDMATLSDASGATLAISPPPE
jgi:hypothetical protein